MTRRLGPVLLLPFPLAAQQNPGAQLLLIGDSITQS